MLGLILHIVFQPLNDFRREVLRETQFTEAADASVGATEVYNLLGTIEADVGMLPEFIEAEAVDIQLAYHSIVGNGKVAEGTLREPLNLKELLCAVVAA